MPDQSQLPSLLYQVDPIQEANKAPIQYITSDIKAKANVEKYSQNYLDYTQTNQPNSLDAFKDNRIQLKKYNVDLEDAYDTLSDGSLVSRYKDFVVGTDNNERLAQQQTLTEKWGNGAAKLGLKTVTAVAGGTLGILDSLGTLMTTGSLSEAYNSNLNVWLDDFNKKIDYKLPNLYTQQDKEAGLFGQMGQANFYADKLFGGLSFMAGAVVSEAIWSAATVATFGGTSEILALNTAKQAEKGLLWSTKAFGTDSKFQQVVSKAKAWAKMPSTSVLDEAGNVMRGLTNAEKQSTILAYGIGKGADIIVPMMRSAGYESGMEARLYMKQTEENWLDKYKQTNGREPSSQEYADFKDKLSDSGNLVFGANMAVLSLSNYAQLKNTILGRTTARTITNNAFSNSLFGKGFRKLEGGALEAIEATKAQKIFGRTYGLAKGFVAESQEEMAQSVFSGTGDNYMLAEFDKDKTKSTYGLMESFTDAVHKTYTTKEGLTEGLIGGLIGILGGVAGGARNKMKGGEFFESETERKEIQNAVDYSNEFTAKNLAVNIATSNKMMKAQENKDQAERNNDVPAQKYAQTSMHIARIERDSQIGGIEEGKADYAREVNALDNDFLKEELGFTTNEEINAYKDQTIKDYNDASEKYTRNLRYSEALLGEKDSKMEEFKGIGIRTIHRAMAHTFTLGEVARETDNELTATINDEILKLSGVEGLAQANEVQHVLDNVPKQKTEELGKLKAEKTNLTNKLKTLQASLTKEGKLKQGEDATARQNRLLDLTTQIQETEDAISVNNEQSSIAFAGLGIEQYTESGITYEAFENHEKNVKKFNTFMNDLKLKNPERYAKMVGLLAQKDKSIKHIKNYEKAVNLIANKATRIKTVEDWAKKIGLKTDPKQFYLDILQDSTIRGAVLTEDNRQQIENREAFTNDEQSLENVAQSYIDKLLEQNYEGLLKIDQQIVDKYKGEEVASMEMPKEENTTKPINQLQALRDKIKKLTSDVYTSQYIGDALDEKNRHKPKDSDVEEYESLLLKWNRKAEKSLARIIGRPSDYKYKNLGLNEVGIDRLKELNTTLGNWMSFVGTDAGNGESVADLLERVNALEATINADETHRDNTEKNFTTIVEVSEEEVEAKKNSEIRGGQSPVQALITPTKDGLNLTISHASRKLITTFFNDVIDVKPLKDDNGKELGFAVFLEGKEVNFTYNESRGNYQVSKTEWANAKNKLNILTVNFGTASTAINQFVGLDSEGKEQYKIVDGDATYLQTDGSNMVIDEEALNGIKLNETIQLKVSTTDSYNNDNNAVEGFHIYMYRGDKLIGSVPANYINKIDGSIDEKEEGVGLPLLQMRKNAKEYVAKQIAEDKSGLIPLPYTLKAGMVFLGQPNLTLQKDSDGNTTTKQIKFNEKSLQLVVGQGFIINGEVTSSTNVDVNQFIKKLSGQVKDKKVPFVIFDYNGKNTAFPIDLISEGDSRSSAVFEMLQSGIDNTEKIKQFIQALTDANIDSNQFGINYTDSENFTTQTELNGALDKLSKLTKVVDMDEFAKKTYRKENLVKDATIALELDGVPFLSSKLMISISNEITDVSVPLEEQVKELKQQETLSINSISQIGEVLIVDYNSNLQEYVDKNEKGLEGVYADTLDGKDADINPTSDIGRRGIVNTIRKATGSKTNEEVINKEIEKVKKEYASKLNVKQVEERVTPYTEAGQLKGVSSDSQMSMIQGADNNTITLLIDPAVKKEYSQKLKQYKAKFNNKGENFKNILKDVAKRYLSTYGKDVIIDLRGIDLNQIEDNIIFDLENSKQNSAVNRQNIINERDAKIAQLRTEIKVTDLKNVDGEITVRVPNIVKERMPKGMFNTLQSEIRNLDKTRAKIKAMEVAIVDRDLARKAKQAEIDNSCGA
jgi:hypothetical protein